MVESDYVDLLKSVIINSSKFNPLCKKIFLFLIEKSENLTKEIRLDLIESQEGYTKEEILDALFNFDVIISPKQPINFNKFLMPLKFSLDLGNIISAKETDNYHCSFWLSKDAKTDTDSQIVFTISDRSLDEIKLNSI